MKKLFSACLLALLWVGSVQAHETSRAALKITPAEAPGQAMSVVWEIALADLDVLLDLDRNLDGALTIDEFNAGRAAMIRLTESSLTFDVGGHVCTPVDVTAGRAYGDRASYGQLAFWLDCDQAAGPLQLDYRLFQGLDANHRVLVNSGGSQWLVTPGESILLMSADDAEGGRWHAFTGFVGEGVRHILIGWDHLAFLLTLMVPALMLRRRADGSRTRMTLKAAGMSLALTITAFTLAHSLTLLLATTGWITLPAGPVEAVIAASIVLAAVAGLLGYGRVSTARLAFGFGLVHGLGFANVMQATGAAGHGLIVGLAGFNIGVEIGQLFFVGLLFPLLWLLVRAPGVGRWVGPGLSASLILVGSVWFAERLGGWELLPG